MPIMIPLTSAEHGGRSACGSCGASTCGPTCECGCPYAAMGESGSVEPIFDIEQRYPGEWLALVIPANEDEFAPEHALLVAHSTDDEELWQAVANITHNQMVHVYFNGTLDDYLEWAEAAPAEPEPRAPLTSRSSQ